MASISTRKSGFAKPATWTTVIAVGCVAPYASDAANPALTSPARDEVDRQLRDVGLRRTGLGEHGEDVAQRLLGLRLSVSPTTLPSAPTPFWPPT